MKKTFTTLWGTLFLFLFSFTTQKLDAQCNVTLSSSAPELTCAVTAVNIEANATGTAPFSYLWSNGGETTQVMVITAPGTYTVTTTDGNGCSATSSITITEDVLSPIAQIIASDYSLNCYNGGYVWLDAASSTGQGTLSYEWSNGSTSAYTDVFWMDEYTVTVTDDDNGCTATSSIYIYDDFIIPYVQIDLSAPELTCDVTSIVADASNSATFGGTPDYAWSTGEYTSSITITSPGTYSLTLTDTYNGCMEFQEFVITEDITPPTADIYASDYSLNCYNGAYVFLDASNSAGQGTLSYAWSTGETIAQINVFWGDEYTVTVTDSDNGCTATSSIYIFDDFFPPTVQIDLSASELNCITTSIVADASNSITWNGAADYQWSTGEYTPSITITAPGTYSLTLTDIYNGCMEFQEVVITEDVFFPVVDITASSTEISPSTPIAYLDASGSSGQGTILYEWSTLSTGAIIGVSTPDTYTVTVTDGDNGCTATNSIVITEAANDLYVDHTATGANNGSSWANAYTDLQDALAVGTNATIHVAKGTYYPTTSTIKGIAFEMPEGSTLLGGYPNGGGTRNYATNATILSGDIDGLATYAGNSYHVVSVKDVNNVTIDGVVIRDGNAYDASSFGRSRGGGLYVKGSTFTLKNSEVKWNKSIYGAGIFATLSPTVLIENCVFKKNTGDNGSAIYHSNQTDLTVDRTKIIDNNSLVRCAVEVNNSLETTIKNSLIANNASGNANGIAFIATNRDGIGHIINSTILGETNDRFLITMQIGFGDQLDLTIDNSIISHQDPSFVKTFKAYNNNILNLNTNYCYIQGSSVMGNTNNNLYSATAGNLILNPDYSLNPCSPGVDAGNNSLSMGAADVDGTIRILSGTVDMGAFENTMVCREASAVETAQAKQMEYAVFPNPTSDKITIQTEMDNPTFYLMDIMGKRLMTTQENEINMSALPSGMYLLRIQVGDDWQTEKIIKK